MQAGASWRREPRRTSLAAPTLPRDATLGTSRDLPEGAMTRRQADLALLLATALWGTSFVAVKSALADATPFAFLTVRFGLAALALAPPAGSSRAASCSAPSSPSDSSRRPRDS